MTNKLLKISIVASAIMPMFALAISSLQEGVGEVWKFVDALVPLLIGVAVLYFIYTLIKYLTKAGEERAKAAGQMVMGVIIIAVMVSVWGLVSIVQRTVGVDSGAPAQFPEIPQPGM